MPPTGSWLAPLSFQIDLRLSADPVDVRNGLQQKPRPQAESIFKFACKSVLKTTSLYKAENNVISFYGKNKIVLKHLPITVNNRMNKMFNFIGFPY